MVHVGDQRPTMILVTGATGTNGREVVNRLAAAGQQVRALVRGTAKAAGLALPGGEVVEGDLGDPASLDRALNGVRAAFLLTAVDRRQNEWQKNFIEAAKRAMVARVVKFSGMGAASDSPSEIMRQHGAGDELLMRSGLGYTILRPNSFHQNMLWSAGSIKALGALYLPLGDARQSLVDVRDIADIAAAALTKTGHEGQVYDITGPESLSYHDVAAKLSAVLGKPVRYVAVSPQAALESMLGSGMPEWNARALSELYGVFATGQYARTTDTVRRLLGREPVSFEQFAREHAAAFR